jgi:hypothetical protein
MPCLHCALHNNPRRVSNSADEPNGSVGSNDVEHAGGNLQRVFSFSHRTQGVSMNWTKPKELGRELLVAVRGARHSIEVVMDVISTTFMTTRTSLVVARVINPTPRISARGFVERHRTEK